MATWLPIIWIGLLGTAVALYVVLDGFDLGIGILFPFSPERRDRDVMMNSVAPFWDGNETWLILAAAVLFVAFPLAYGIIMSGLYLPVIIMLLALVFRASLSNIRWVAKPHHGWWDIAFAGGSITAAFMQGVILGELLQRLPVKTATSAAACSTGSSHSPCSSVSPPSWATLCSARRGSLCARPVKSRLKHASKPGDCCSSCSLRWRS